MKKRVVIIGAGLGGCVVADGLAGALDVTVVELGNKVDLQARVHDVAVPAATDPHIAAGFGGTTRFWHNGLIEIDEAVFADRWPFPKSVLARFYESAYPMLGGSRRPVVESGTAILRRKYSSVGVPMESSPGLFIPKQRRNLWESLRLDGRVRVVQGEAIDFDTAGTDRVTQVTVKTARGQQRIDGDVFVLAAGGLSTPLLLQKLAEKLPLPALEHAGKNYEDHPMGFVGEVTLEAPLYRFWNFAAPGTAANIRMPIVVEQDGLLVSFQLRPAASYYRTSRRERLSSVLNDLRNKPFNPLGYLRLLKHSDDVLDILSWQFGIKVPTKRYTLLMVAEQPPSSHRAVRPGKELRAGGPTIEREWTLEPDYLATLRKSIDTLAARLGRNLKDLKLFDNWQESLYSAAHHSGTARMSATAADGVCDANARVHGMKNLYVADGSLIPASGIANTGLTIGALGLRLADHLRATTQEAA